MDDVMLSYQFNCESSVGGGREISQEEALLEHASKRVYYMACVL